MNRRDKITDRSNIKGWSRFLFFVVVVVVFVFFIFYFFIVSSRSTVRNRRDKNLTVLTWKDGRGPDCSNVEGRSGS